MASVAIIGIGRIGLRHLEALARADGIDRIVGIDPSPAAREAARALWDAGGGGSPARLALHAGVEDLPAEIDVAIVATRAENRRETVEAACRLARIRHMILEKPVAQRVADLEAVAGLLAAHGTAAWVNCPRRLWPVYREFRRGLEAGAPVVLGVTCNAGQHLASNAIHWLDLLAYLSGRADMTVDAGGLTPTACARRPGAEEFTGTLTAATASGDRLTLTSFREGTHPLCVDIATPGHRLFVCESQGLAFAADAAGGWSWRQQPGAPVWQSRLGHLVVGSLLAEGHCGLVPLAESIRLHRPLLDGFLERFRSFGLADGDRCPVT